MILLLSPRRLIVKSIKNTRMKIRSHRDQKLGNRRWPNDYSVWGCIKGSPVVPTNLSHEEVVRRCREFYTHRRSETRDQVPAEVILSRNFWNSDLREMTMKHLDEEQRRLKQAILCHRDIVERPRTLNDDRALYRVLPEKLVADFRLPPGEELPKS